MQTTTNIKTKDFFIKAIEEVVINNERKALLKSIAHFIAKEKIGLKKVRLNFICTHNSRRSQLAQIWAHYAIQYHKLRRTKSYSGGTEIAALHRNTINTLQHAGFNFELKIFSHENPVYEVTFQKNRRPITAFSKLYNDSMNKKPFIAITTCKSAEQNCPFIPDSLIRFHVGYDDPKVFDYSPIREEKYLDTNKIIAAEMNYLFQQVSELT